MSKNTDTRRDEIYRLILAEGSVRVNEDVYKRQASK